MLNLVVYNLARLNVSII